MRSAEQLVGKSEGGPGTWQLSPKRSGGADYQEQIAGVQRGIEYAVPYAPAKEGVIRFDGYDAERKVLLDAKDWNGYPPKDREFWYKNTLKEAQNQIDAAGGRQIEWHFSTKDGLDATEALLERREIRGIALVLTPKK